MKTLKLKVTGMHCPSCETLLKDSIEEIDGVKKAEASHKAGTVTVEYDDKKAYLDAIKNIIKKEGYAVI